MDQPAYKSNLAKIKETFIFFFLYQYFSILDDSQNEKNPFHNSSCFIMRILDTPYNVHNSAEHFLGCHFDGEFAPEPYNFVEGMELPEELAPYVEDIFSDEDKMVMAYQQLIRFMMGNNLADEEIYNLLEPFGYSKQELQNFIDFYTTIGTPSYNLIPSYRLAQLMGLESVFHLPPNTKFYVTSGESIKQYTYLGRNIGGIGDNYHIIIDSYLTPERVHNTFFTDKIYFDKNEAAHAAIASLKHRIKSIKKIYLKVGEEDV